ncbi:gamma-glutamyl-gamma-aminobutyrate hydrolase family protein [Streptomyces violascens]|uniref:gamma-glutamyl-gamma-aminobutyrate hydrolase family protein n=1 Tax=Streptomyces violascens TaxID=67381 RepID=UPI001CFE4CBC|nr:gamma-glutamyl-gamma-aminobutyrate hydrolase family protein [Streptomyces violascens]
MSRIAARRPLVAVPARFAASTSALRYAAEVNARALIEAVWRAGGEPVTLHPHAPGGRADPAEVGARLARFDGVLLPGGGDIAPVRYAAEPHAGGYDIDAEQDGFDLEVTYRALELGLPLLAVCRGLQVVNVALGGTLDQDMGGAAGSHRHYVHRVAVRPGTLLARAAGATKVTASCYHHQRVDRLGMGLTVTARAADDTVEGLELPAHRGWFVAVQWHPEDTARGDAAQRGVFGAFVRAAARVTEV